MSATTENAPRLAELLPAAQGKGADELLNAFLTWVRGQGLELYPAQEEAILELMAGKHLVLGTPTGSGKSLVALAVHFKALCEGGRAFYTSPIKALASEKFFALCRELGAERVGMLTGDASINPKAPIICCTAEILANLALREGRHARVDYAVLDEFHYYGDRDRGIAWQIPLLELNDTRFVLMSATLGDTTELRARLAARTGQEVAWVHNRDRPVPLDFAYRETPLHETVTHLVAHALAPIYLVSFSQREAADAAQSLSSLDLSSKEEKKALAAALRGFRFDTAYGKDVQRLVRQGLAVHHAGMLPKYRLLVERLAQQGLLKVVSGTDTLGVGVNVPIRTVLFSRLYKYDGERTRLLSAREFHQIAGRAGRKGFDARGSVVCQAPEHVIENKLLDQKAERDGRKPKANKKRPPTEGYVHYDAQTFARLIAAEPEPLRSRFQVNHNLLMNVLSRELSHGRRDGGYRRLIDLIAKSDESEANQRRHRRSAAALFRALERARVIERTRPEWDPRTYVRVRPELQRDFSLHHTLSLFLVEAIADLDPEGESYALDALSLVEAIVEDPQVILFRQVDKLKGERLAELKAAGVEYEERIAELDKVVHPQPNAEAILTRFAAFAEAHPWVGHEALLPKSIARDMLERYASFNDYVHEYGLQRSEGVLLRYLSGVYKVLVQTVPDEHKTAALLDAMAFLRTALAHVDDSLVREWETLLVGDEEHPEAPPVAKRPELWRDSRVFHARLRAEVHRLVKELASGRFEAAGAAIWQPAEPDGEGAWSAERLGAELAPLLAEHGRLRFDHQARLSEHTLIRELGPRRWELKQALLGGEGESTWALVAEIDLSEPDAADGPLLRLQRFER